MNRLMLILLISLVSSATHSQERNDNKADYTSTRHQIYFGWEAGKMYNRTCDGLPGLSFAHGPYADQGDGLSLKYRYNLTKRFGIGGDFDWLSIHGQSAYPEPDKDSYYYGNEGRPTHRTWHTLRLNAVPSYRFNYRRWEFAFHAGVGFTFFVPARNGNYIREHLTEGIEERVNVKWDNLCHFSITPGATCTFYLNKNVGIYASYRYSFVFGSLTGHYRRDDYFGNKIQEYSTRVRFGQNSLMGLGISVSFGNTK